MTASTRAPGHGTRQPLTFFAAVALFSRCAGHGHMTLPPSRNGGTLEKAADCLHGECMWFSQPNSNFTKNPATGRPDDPVARIPGAPTLDAQALRTYNVDVSGGVLDYTRTSPWRSPGAAQVLGSGCGVGAGGPEREMDGGTAREFGLVQNMDGKDLPRLSNTRPVTWFRNSTVEVAWANNANHVSFACANLSSSPCLKRALVGWLRAVATRIVSARLTAKSPRRVFRLGISISSGRLRGSRRKPCQWRPASAATQTTRLVGYADLRPTLQGATLLLTVGPSTPGRTASQIWRSAQFLFSLRNVGGGPTTYLFLQPTTTAAGINRVP
eukprot:COSAG05_NODE_90_length_20140_cov_25.117060_8_plen_327_part_00